VVAFEQQGQRETAEEERRTQQQHRADETQDHRATTEYQR